jgi:hypothetical protein
VRSGATASSGEREMGSEREMGHVITFESGKWGHVITFVVELEFGCFWLGKVTLGEPVGCCMP